MRAKVGGGSRFRALLDVNAAAIRAYVIFTVLVCGEGLLLLLSGPGRSSSPSFATIRHMTMGPLSGPKVYGVACLVVGALLIIAPTIGQTFTRIGFTCAICLNWILAISFGTATLADPNAGSLAWWTYFCIGIWGASQRVMYREPWRQEPRR